MAGYLRLIPLLPNWVNCPHLTTCWRGQRHGLVFVLLPTRLMRSRVALHHGARHVVQAGSTHPTRTSSAQAPPLQGAQSLRGLDPQASLRSLYLSSRAPQTTPTGPPTIHPTAAPA